MLTYNPSLCISRFYIRCCNKRDIITIDLPKEYYKILAIINKIKFNEPINIIDNSSMGNIKICRT